MPNKDSVEIQNDLDFWQFIKDDLVGLRRAITNEAAYLAHDKAFIPPVVLGITKLLDDYVELALFNSKVRLQRVSQEDENTSS